MKFAFACRRIPAAAVVAWGVWLASASATRLSGGSAVYVADTVEINDDLLGAARNITVNGHIRGDLITGAMSTTVDGQVDGSIIAFCYDFKLTGNCRNSVRAFAGRVDIDGHVERNLIAFGQTVALSRQGWVEKDVHVGAATLLVQGRVGGILRADADEVFISGQIDGDVKITSDNIVIQPTAIIGGNLITSGKKDPKIEPGAQILGQITHELPKKAEGKGGYGFGDFLGDMWSLLALAATGGLLLGLFRGFVREVTESIKTQWAKSLGLGFVFLVCLPIAAAILALTLIGIPLALVVLAGWLLLFYLAKVFAGLLVGEWALTKLRHGRPAPAFWAMVVGLVIILLVLKIPYLWFVVKVAILMFGFGGFFLAASRRHTQGKTANQAVSNV